MSGGEVGAVDAVLAAELDVGEASGQADVVDVVDDVDDEDEAAVVRVAVVVGTGGSTSHQP